jgi:RNA polymerase sigma-70 factor (ECF subfamily)
MKEQDIINKILDGDIESFSILIDSYQDILSAYLLTQTRNKEDAEDIVQETFINAHKYLNSYNSQWKFKSWLFIIAKRLLYNYYKKIRTLDYSDLESYDSINECSIEESNIWAIIKSSLNQHAFDVIWFYYSEELTIKEIAKILQCTHSRVKMSLFRSKRKLAQIKEIESLFNDLVLVG